MQEVERMVAANAGVVTTAQLLAAGLTRLEIRRLSNHGWKHLRQGWHAAPFADEVVERTVRSGGVLACVSVLRRHGVWTLTTQPHIRFPPTHRGHRATNNCRPFRLNEPARTSMDSLTTALDSAANCLGHEELIVVFDSMLNKKMIELADVRTVVHSSPPRNRGIDEKCDKASESGLETLTRIRLRAEQIDVRTQVEVPGVGYVDLLIGKRLVIECDGEAFHQNFQADRTRDRHLKALGFEVVRLTYDDIVHNWKESYQDILAIHSSARTSQTRADRGLTIERAA